MVLADSYKRQVTAAKDKEQAPAKEPALKIARRLAG
jgi:hypothetical protein